MKKNFRLLSLILVFIMTFTLNMSEVYSEQNEKSITILFTHDMHDHFYPYDIQDGGNIKTVGGYSRLKSAIDIERKKDSELLLVDAGDFSMGTLFQTIFSSDAPELRIMGKMGYDIVTFGNHEFDFRAEGLGESLVAARKSGDKVPQIVASNIFFPEDDNGKLTPTLEKLQKAMKYYGVEEYTVIERNNIKIGIFGLMGKDADSNAPMSEVEFTDTIESAKKIVDILENEEKVDLILCLSHSGTWKDKSKSEDEILAKEVPEIDVIISGHTHTKLEEPILVDNTIIGSCGKYGENLGILKISQSIDGQWEIEDYKLKPIDDKLPMDLEIEKTIEDYKEIVQDKYLNKFGLDFDEVLAYTPFNFTSTAEIGKAHAEDTLGNLISDAYIHAVKEVEGENYEPIAAAVVPSGTIRGSFVEGDITVSDVFVVSSLGIGPDKVSGYPLIEVYLTGKELKTVAEVDASITPIMSVAQLYISGLSYTFNPNRLIFNKVTDIVLENPDGSTEEIQDNKLYRVVAGLYSAQMLSVVGDKSFGLLSIVPKTKDGVPIEDYEGQIIYESTNGKNNEIKEWLAIANYLKSFNQVNGIPQVPYYYNELQGRKVVDNNTNIFALLKNPNSIALTVYILVILLIVIAILIVRIIIKRQRRKRAKKSLDL